MALSTVTFMAGGRKHELRLSARAGCELEERFDKSIAELMNGAVDGFGYRFVCAVFTACLNDGAGVSEDVAYVVIDSLGGLPQAAEHLTAMITKAFPEAADDTSGPKAGNAKTKAA